MDKKTLLQLFNEEDRVDIINLYEKYQLALDKDIPLFGNNFYPPKVWKTFESDFATKDFKVNSFGFFEEAERRMISFNNLYDIPYPIKILKIENISKFSNPEHRDYLGSILALGINRNKMGDLLLKDGMCYLPVCEEIADFILNNLNSIGNSPCRITILDDDFIPPKPDFNEEIIQVQSLRIDSITAKLCKTSRSKAQGIIEDGKVLIDYSKIRDKSIEVSEGERITIRGIGKFILGEIVGNTKSGKYKVLVKKYT